MLALSKESFSSTLLMVACIFIHVISVNFSSYLGPFSSVICLVHAYFLTKAFSSYSHHAIILTRPVLYDSGSLG